MTPPDLDRTTALFLDERMEAPGERVGDGVDGAAHAGTLSHSTER